MAEMKPETWLETLEDRRDYYMGRGQYFQAAVVMLAAGHPPEHIQTMLAEAGSIWDYSDVVQAMAEHWLKTRAHVH